ncbi:MAG: SDR family oxidoreductase [Opitutaceae bacterium]|nr:SDR family oxidoreductase [Opitutaceae bacterium]
MKADARPVAIVTGGAGPGIGHGLSEALASAGWDLVITDRNAKRGAAWAERLRGLGGAVEVVVADVTEPDAPTKTMSVALKCFGRLDGLVNNVGVGLVKKAGEVRDEELQALWSVDFFASFRFVRAALPALIKAQGAVVNIGSVHARLAAPKYALYAATKAALDAFTRGLAADYGRQGVRANIVHPGLVESPQNEVLLANLVADPKKWIAEFASERQCLPRLTTAREVGELVAFLLGKNARSITGQSIFIDGGTTTLLWDNKEGP